MARAVLALTLVAAVVAGLVLGLLGGGGSILTLPILIYLAGMPTREAIAASLVVVTITSTVAVIPHARADRVRWRTAGAFATAGVAGAYAGGRLAEHLPATLLLVGFGLLMAATAVAMLRPRTNRPVPPARSTPGRVLPLGAAAGLVTGILGAGGGFIIVPMLTVVAGLAMSDAIGTSLVIIALQAGAGLLGHLHTVDLDWPLTLTVTVAAVIGSLAGARLAGRIPPARLRTAFGWLVIIMATAMLAGQLPSALRTWFLSLAATAALAILAVAVAPRNARSADARQACHTHTDRQPAPLNTFPGSALSASAPAGHRYDRSLHRPRTEMSGPFDP